MLGRFCRTAGDDLIRLGDDAVRVGAGATDDLLRGAAGLHVNPGELRGLGLGGARLTDDLGLPLAARAAVHAGDELVAIAESENGLAKLFPLAKETRTAGNLGLDGLRSRIRTDAVFRRELESELRALRATRSGELRIHFPELVRDEEKVRLAAAGRALEREHPPLLDATGKPLRQGTPLYELVNDEYRKRALDVFAKALDKLPPAKALDEKEIATALQSALRDVPPTSYRFDLATGDLKLLLKTQRGEITGSVNAYRVMKRGAVVAAVMWHGQLASQFSQLTGLPVDQRLKALKLRFNADRNAELAEKAEADLEGTEKLTDTKTGKGPAPQMRQ
jgi:hypothetical protein